MTFLIVFPILYLSEYKLIHIEKNVCMSVDLCHRYYATIASVKTPSHTMEVVTLFKALSELGSHPQLVECIEVTARGLALHSQHRDALSLLHEVEDIQVCYIPTDYYCLLMDVLCFC